MSTKEKKKKVRVWPDDGLQHCLSSTVRPILAAVISCPSESDYFVHAVKPLKSKAKKKKAHINYFSSWFSCIGSSVGKKKSEFWLFFKSPII